MKKKQKTTHFRVWIDFLKMWKLWKRHLQFLQLLAKFPSIWANDAHGILADPENAQHAQTIQPAFVNLSKVIVVQLTKNLMTKRECISVID